MDRLFVAYKEAGLSSNAFLRRLKRKYGVKKAGFSGTLDPFAKGCLLIAFGKYTKLFRFLKTEPKSYEAVLWLGASSPGFDTQDIKIANTPALKYDFLQNILDSLQGRLEYTPPKFSAKKVNGVRAYKLAREGVDFELKPTFMQVFHVELLSYNHPFVKIRLSVSKGSYIRSYSQLVAQKLGINIALSSLERLSEGDFIYENEKELDPLKYLGLKENFIICPNKLDFGKKIALDELRIHTDGDYLIKTKDYFSVVGVENGEVFYHLNKVGRC